jgi:protein-S-isoprenylcysteine O-methyltransferase Ste14
MYKEIVGSTLIIAGLALSNWARHTLGRNWDPLDKTPKQLITTGPYRFCKHPMYEGGFLWVVGVFIYLSWWQALGAFVPLYITLQSYRAHAENVLLHKTFGWEYVKYWNRTWF